jgi:hypothetical protein
MHANVALEAPAANEYADYYGPYIVAVPEGDILTILRDQGREACTLFESIDDDRARWRYGEGKWSIKEILGHLADSERVFSYRALRIARGDATPLPGFDQDKYVVNARFDELPLMHLVEDLAVVRASTISLFRSFDPSESRRMGTASDCPVSVRALAYMIAGHEAHHLRIANERYLQTT